MWLFICLILTYGANCENIPWNTYKFLSPVREFHEFDNIFDNDLETFTDIFMDSRKSFSVAIMLQEEYAIESVFINTEIGIETLHEIRVGFLNDKQEKTLPFKCLPQESGYLCHFPCLNGNEFIPFMAKNVVWVMHQQNSSAWARINEISVQGTRSKIQDFNIARQKPFIINGIAQSDSNYCQGQYWEIFDISPPKSTSPRVSKLMTVYFGRNYIIKEMLIKLPLLYEENIEFQFGTSKTLSVILNITNECEHLEDKEFQHLKCSLSTLGPLPFDQVEFFTKEIVKLEIHGIPIQYPTVTLSTSETVSAREPSAFEITCTAATCSGFPGSCFTQLEEVKQQQQEDEVMVVCKEIMLLRRPTGGDSDFRDPSIVTRGAELNPIWKDVLEGLSVNMVQNSKIVARIPKTHKFAGQYQCACNTSDAVGTQVYSTVTAFQMDDFLTEAIFQRTYSVTYCNNERSLGGGSSIIELPTPCRGGYFKMAVTGFTFFADLQVSIERLEEGQRKRLNSLHTQEVTTKMFPGNKALENWTIPAKQIFQPDIFPDVKDNETVTFHWSHEKSLPVGDVFKIVEVDMRPSVPVRAWLLSNTDGSMHMLVYCQHSNSSGTINSESEIKVELVVRGCNSDDEPRILADFGLKGTEANIGKLPMGSRIEELDFGLVVNILVMDYSKSSRYELRAIDGNIKSTLLDIPPSQTLELTGEVKDANIEVLVTKYSTTPDSEEIRLELSLSLLSPVLLSHVNCTSSSLKLIPAWNSEAARNLPIDRVPSMFDLTSPKSLQNLEIAVELTFGEISKTMTISVPNPHYEQVEIEFDNTTGILSWGLVSAAVRPAVREYEISVSLEDIGCDTTVENFRISEVATLNCTQLRGCSTHFWSLEPLFHKRDIPARYTVTVTPKYIGFDFHEYILDTSSELKFIHGVEGHSALSLEKTSSAWTQEVSLLPFRKLACEGADGAKMDATFELTAYAMLTQGKMEMPLDGVRYSKLHPNTQGVGGVYLVENLQPGRQYKLRGALKYPGPLSDLMSSEVLFTTPDDVRLPVKEVRRDPSSSLLVFCSAAVGTDPRFQKSVFWHRAGGEPMPEGVFSQTASMPDDQGFLNASLSIPAVNESHAGVYCCSVEPPVEHLHGKSATCNEFRLIVSYLQITRKIMYANPGMSVAVTCSTPRQGGLEWRRADGHPTLQALHTSPGWREAGGVQDLTLFIPEVNAATVGEYQCTLKPQGVDEEVSETFTLGNKTTLTLRRPDDMDGEMFGGTTTLICNHIDGNWKPRWYRYLPANEALVDLNTTENGLYEILSDGRETRLRLRNTPTSKGQYVCADVSGLLEMEEGEEKEQEEEEISMTTFLQRAIQYIKADINYRSVVSLSDPIKKNGTEDVVVRCKGFPSQVGEHLEWTFKEDDGNSSDAERISRIMSCFSTKGDKRVASWPGSVTSNSTSPDVSSSYSPEETELRVTPEFQQNPLCTAALGKLICQYRIGDLIPTSTSKKSSMEHHSSSVPTAWAEISLYNIKSILQSSEKTLPDRGTYTPQGSTLLTCLLLVSTLLYGF